MFFINIAFLAFFIKIVLPNSIISHRFRLIHWIYLTAITFYVFVKNCWSNAFRLLSIYNDCINKIWEEYAESVPEYAYRRARVVSKISIFT